MATVAGVFMQKSGTTVTPLRVKSPETAVTAMARIRDEMSDMVQRCQALLLTAAETAPDEEELDDIQDRLAELRAEIEAITGEE
jgi:flagellin-like hook-associated protein FlgL